MTMYVPAWPVLRPRQLFGPGLDPDAPLFPFGRARSLDFHVARGALYHLFRALGGGTVLAPAYHHGNEVRALRAAGASVRFYGVNRRLEPDLEALDKACRPPVSALLVIHYLGWPQPIAALAALCRDRGIVLVEDCALALFSESGGRPLGSFGDYSVFCLYKTLPVPNGGLLVANSDWPRSLPALDLPTCDPLSLAGRCAELILGGLRMRWERLGSVLVGLKQGIGRNLTAAGVRRVPVGDEGFDVGQANLGMSPLSKKILRRCDHAAIRSRRRQNYRLMLERLAGRVALLRETLEPGVCPLFFPLLVADKTEATRRLAAAGIETVPFWNQGDALAADGFPDVRFLRERVLELPIHQDVTPEHVEHMAAQVLGQRLAMAA